MTLFFKPVLHYYVRLDLQSHYSGNPGLFWKDVAASQIKWFVARSFSLSTFITAGETVHFEVRGIFETCNLLLRKIKNHFKQRLFYKMTNRASNRQRNKLPNITGFVTVGLRKWCMCFLKLYFTTVLIGLDLQGKSYYFIENCTFIFLHNSAIVYYTWVAQVFRFISEILSNSTFTTRKRFKQTSATRIQESL